MREYKVGEKVLDIYEFMSYFLNPHQKHRSFIYEVKSVNSKFFSIYDMTKFDLTAPGNQKMRIERDKDISFEKIISTLEVTPYRQPIYLRVKEDKETIEKCKKHLFEIRYERDKQRDREKIAALEKEIAEIKKNGLFKSKRAMEEREEAFDTLFNKASETA